MRAALAGIAAVPVVALFVFLFGACASPAPPPPPAPAPAPAAPPRDVAPTEPGFTYCCGNAQFRMEIDCREMLKRCYEHDGGTWRQTYGRHCKDELGEACYLTACEQKC